uniref:protein-glutamine gamma-glutamyltransferase K-like n=1 Tax=Myxine glutinosa TaxID=7769 RepID=UPI00358E950F
MDLTLRQASPSISLTLVSSAPAKNQALDCVSTEPSVLQVWKVNIDHGEAKKTHHTEDYDSAYLVLRRGFPFKVELILSRPFEPTADRLQMELFIGSRPSFEHGTYIPVPLEDDLHSRETRLWGATVLKSEGNVLSLLVHTSPKCIVGKFQVCVATLCHGYLFRTARHHAPNVYFIFNPWCPDDLVYMASEAERCEYILQDVGHIYYGTADDIMQRSWNFGQFDFGILDACILLLDQGKLPLQGRDSPVTISRVVSALVNSKDDNGVLEGNWSGMYGLGTPPEAWNGSTAILLDFRATRRPVAYGQCWVFSGVATTVLRSLGIPSRPITNFESAHDADASLSFDVFVDENMEILKDHMKDSKWNYHSWAEGWMARPDLPLGYGGWQVVDPTPQETSEGVYCCGPAPVNAVRDGIVYLKYDIKFVFAEVNSDKVYWQLGADGRFKAICVDRNVVGVKISTKAVGSEEREDITHQYKHTEGSEKERIAVEMACRHGSKPGLYGRLLERGVGEPLADPRPQPDDVWSTIAVQGIPEMGRDITVGLRVGSTSESAWRHVTLHVRCDVMYYTGVVHGCAHKGSFTVEVPPKQDITTWLQLPYSAYGPLLVTQAAMLLTVTGRVGETNQPIMQQKTFRLRLPRLNLKVLGEPVVGRDILIEITFHNPLPEELSDVGFLLEATGAQESRRMQQRSIAAGGTVRLQERITPRRRGVLKVLASLYCSRLHLVHGETTAIVR